MARSIPLPPSDQSGGILQVNYTDGLHTHRMNLHVQSMSSDDGTYTLPTNGGVTDNGFTSEAHLQDTFNNFAARWKRLYGASWTMTPYAFYRNRNIGQTGPANMQQVWPLPVTGAVVGIDPNTPLAAQEIPAGQMTWTCRTKNGGRGRIVLLGSPEWQASAPQIVTGAASGFSNPWQEFVGYLTSKATGITGHDGYQLMGPMHVTQTLNKRLRRSYHMT